MLSRLANVLQDLSGEESPDGDSQGVLDPRLPVGDHQISESEVPEEAMERLAHLEQLVVQLKELIRDKDSQLLQKDTELANKDAQIKSESEAAEARFTKLKLQAKVKMASLTKQINELKGHEGAATPDSSFTGACGASEEELQELRTKLSQEEDENKNLRDKLQAIEQLLQDKESAHGEQVQILQAVVCEKDVRFQEQIQKHEEELLRVTSESHSNEELQEALHAAQRKCEELEETVISRSQVLEMLQQELNSADQQKQILTIQFRQMEQELAESVRLREEERQQLTQAQAEISSLRNSLETWEAEKAEMARLQSELVAMKEVELVSQEALQKEKTQVERLEQELAQLRESEEVLERSRAEMERVERELESVREAEAERMFALEREKSEVDKLNHELTTLRAEREQLQEQSTALNEVWRHLRSLDTGGCTAPDEGPVCIDPTVLIETVQSIEAQLFKLKQEHSDSEKRCLEFTYNIDILQEQLDRHTKDNEEASSKIQHLEQQIKEISESGRDPESSDADTSRERISALERLLMEKDDELSAFKASLAQKHESAEVTEVEIPKQSDESTTSALQDLLEETQDEETTLVAEDTSVLSMSADNESSPELIGTQSESPEESKASSDEMVASSDSEVAHSSWTLLEAVNQEGGPEWPSVLQDFSQLQSSWETTSMEQESSTVQVESSSVIIHETVEVHLTQDTSSSEQNVSSGQVFAQVLAEELQKRYSELLAELQRLRQETGEAQKKICALKEETYALTVAKEAAESQASHFEQKLNTVREELDNVLQNGSIKEKQQIEMQLLEEQIDILNNRCTEKEESIQALKIELKSALDLLTEQQSQARMLSVQLEDREHFSSELEEKLRDLGSSQSDINNESLLKKDSEISELHLRLSEKEQEIIALNDSMSAKLIQAQEETSLVHSEMNKLKEEMQELRNIVDDKETSHGSTLPDEDTLLTLQKEKEELKTQLTNTKKKLQMALVQRKELMKKVANLEENKVTDQDVMEEKQMDKRGNKEFEKMEVKLSELEKTLKEKEEVVESLEQKIRQQDQVLAEALALNRKLSKEDESSQQMDNLNMMTLQSQVVSLEGECDSLQKKVQEAQESRKDTLRKAKEKDRHHREQLKQLKEEYSELMGRFEKQSDEKEVLQQKLRELEMHKKQEIQSYQESQLEVKTSEKSAANDWGQEDWVDFAAPEPDTAQQQPSSSESRPEQGQGFSVQVDESLDALREEIYALQKANTELENKLADTHAILSLKDTKLLAVTRDLQLLKEKEIQIDIVSEEMNVLREKYQQAQSYAESLKAEMDAAVKTASVESASSIAALQAEIADFRLFLDNKNQEIMELSQQLQEQNTLIRSMETAVSHKDELIVSLQEELKAEQEKTQRLEVEVPQKQEEEKDSETKIQQLQRKLQAALISRKEVLKENKTIKEQLASTEQVLTELKEKMSATEEELEKLQSERDKLISEVDRLLLENQSLGSSCESLKLVMDGIISEKDNYQREAELAKEEAAHTCREWEEKVQNMKEEYETLLKSYENVSDEAERVRRVLEAAKQERQELASKVRAHEALRLEAERQAEEAKKEVDTVKDKMRKFAKTKQQKIMELEEENERLREQQEKAMNVSPDDRGLKAEFEKACEDLRALQTELEETKNERDILSQHIDELREEIAQREFKESETTAQSTAAVQEEIVTAQTSDMTMTKYEPSEGQEHEETTLEPSNKVAIGVGAPTEKKYELEQMEHKIKDMEAAFATERVQWQKLEAELRGQLATLEQDVEELKTKEITSEQSLHQSTEREKRLAEEGVSRETHFKELLKNLESEKDNLEERLMNQLAQLNGSIASYQQEASDQRQHLAELQCEVETLERERAELEAQYHSEQARALRLEEDMRQAQRQRAEAEAQCGKQRELEQQLRSAERVKEGSQSRSRQLEELLREKQLEVRQLQKDSIQYQERISELGREAKALQIGHDELLKKQQHAQLEISKTVEDLKRTEAELCDCKSQLNYAQEQLKDALADKAAVEQKAQQKETLLKTEAEQTLDSVRFRLGAELKEIELRLEESFREREREEDATAEARDQAEAAERRAQELKTQLDESLARLAAFSRCMSSLQDDRDRILDEARQWENRFNGALQGKEAEVREAETRVKALAEQLQKEIALKEGLQISIDSLENADKEWQQKFEEFNNKFKANKESLEKERSQLEQTTTALQAAQSETLSLQKEVESLHQRTKALEEAVGHLQAEADQARTELRERETEERRLCLNVEQLEADLRSSKALTENLQMELNEKERKEVEMLGETEQAVTQAAEEARKEAEGRAQEAEKELEQRRVELQELEDKLRKAETESNQSKTRLDSFTKAMGSLQDDRDRVLNMYKQLEEKHLQVMMEKDGLIQEAAGENNSLKEELRSLLVQRDDLYAEKAKLAAQLHGYREELNQVLSMKESQHKQLLAAQRQRIATLEKQHKEMENQLRSLNMARDTEGHSRLEEETLSQVAETSTPSQVVVAPGAEVEKLREQLQAARKQVKDLEDTLLTEREAQETKSKELEELKWEGGVMRTESESAQERVAELARDLLAVEQKLLEEKEVTTQLRAEKQSFAKTMASLQDSRDQALNKVQELSLKVEELSRAGSHMAQSGLTSSTGEVWGLKNALQALQNDRERLLEQLESKSSELKKQKSELSRLGAGELIKVSQELFEEKERNKNLLGVIAELENAVKVGKQEIDALHMERVDMMAQAEQLKQQTLVTLSERDQQLRHLSTMLEEVHHKKPQLQEEHYQRQGAEDGAPGAPQQKSSVLETHAYLEEVKELHQRLDQETRQRIAAEEQLQATQDRLSRHSQAQWNLALEDELSETAVFIEPPEGAVTRTRRVGPGLLRMLRVAFCSRQRTPLLLSLYLLTVHVLLLLCLGGYL
ncbi:golgin subfamily B member 1 isoform X2 [Boleophthalmus pectinirostris]|uniref:golgin subfamily B member 1 isoform X2 n=1 Tax=Boleophthalmus pectinirostris TaxID=150288 RepID=UPI00242D79CE|nr:golgin subfamily B member 1 isoform X2 [Boleophthalmus pectinirostris]